jgi:hypothetical protein
MSLFNDGPLRQSHSGPCVCMPCMSDTAHLQGRHSYRLQRVRHLYSSTLTYMPTPVAHPCYTSTDRVGRPPNNPCSCPPDIYRKEYSSCPRPDSSASDCTMAHQVLLVLLLTSCAAVAGQAVTSAGRCAGSSLQACAGWTLPNREVQ